MEQELKQEEATVEQPKEEVSEVSKVTPAVDKATSPKPERVYTPDEFRKMQSMKDKAEATLKSVQSELQKLQAIHDQQRLEQRKKEIESLVDDPDGQSKIRLKHQLEDEVRGLREQKEKEEGAVQRKYDQAAELAKQYSLSLDESRELLDATTPREMELMAQLKAREHEKPTSSKEEKFIPDSGKSDAGGEDDETFLKRYSEGKSDDHKRARKVLQKMK